MKKTKPSQDAVVELINARMDSVEDRLTRIEARQDRMIEIQSKQTEITGRQEENIKEHMRRSKAAEEGIEILKEELKPVQTHVSIVNWAFKAIMSILGLGIIGELVRIWIG